MASASLGTRRMVIAESEEGEGVRGLRRSHKMVTSREAQGVDLGGCLSVGQSRLVTRS